MALLAHSGVRAKVIVAFTSLFFMVEAVGILNAFQMRAVAYETSEIRQSWLPAIEALAELKLMFTRARLIGARTLATADRAEREIVAARHQSFHAWVDEASKRYEGVIKSADERAIYDTFRSRWNDYTRFEAPLLAAPYGDQDAQRGFNFDAQRLYARTLESLDELTALNRGRVVDGLAAGALTFRRALWLTGLATVLAGITALGAAIWLSRSVVARIVQLAGAMRQLAQRDYAFKLPAAGADEIGDITRAVEECRYGLQQADALAAEQRRAERGRTEAEAARSVAEAELRALRVREQAQRELEVQHARFAAALGNMTQGLCMIDGAGQIVVANRRFAELFGFCESAAPPGGSFEGLLTRLGAEGGLSEANVADLRRAARGIAAQKADAFVWELADGRALSVSLRSMQDGGWLATYEDISDRRRAEAQIEYLAHHDALTGLPNRRRFNKALAGLEGGAPLAVLCLDLDQFKSVNDTLGHPVGDALLQAVAERIRSCLTPDDIVARLGGDEFAIIQIGSPQPSAATDLASLLIDKVREPYELNGHHVLAGTSIGIAVAPPDGVDPDRLLKSADLALYRAKADGRGTFRFFEPAMDAHIQERRLLELDLRTAVRSQEFELFYQPFVDLKSNQVSGFEALLRWNHPRRGIVSPAEFVPALEELGLIGEVGRWVLKQACADAAAWPDPLKVAVNLSALQFRNGAVLLDVAAALLASGLEPCRLELEITESVLLQDTVDILALLNALRDLGVRISMDDFGTGYSSLSYLRSFPFDKIKIDRSFVQDMSSKQDSIAIIRAITNLSDSLGMVTTAEGVETPEQLEHLRAEGCTEAQGYLFGRPKPLAEIDLLAPRTPAAPQPKVA